MTSTKFNPRLASYKPDIGVFVIIWFSGKRSFALLDFFPAHNFRTNINIMKNKLTHFAIYTDDIERAQKFYADVFNWNFNSYGQPGFLQIKTDETESGELIGALQSRNFSPVPEKVIGMECTIGVENIDNTIEKVVQNGGRVIMPKTGIPFVGWISKFLDTEGNLFCAMQYDNSVR